MSDKYYRGLRNSLNDAKYKLLLASMTLKINENKNNSNGINSNISEINNFSEKINTNENDISNNLEKINTNDIVEIKSNLNNIKNLSNFKISKNISNYSIQNLFIYNIDIENNYTLNKDNPKFSVFSYNLEDNFKSNSLLEVNCNLLYDYNNYNNIGTLIYVFKLYDENNTLLHEYKNLKSNSGDNLKAFLNQIDLFYVKLNEDYSVIKIELVLSILDNIDKTVSCKLYNSLSSNFVCIKHYKKINSMSINNNLVDLEDNISSNLTKMETNKSNISSNLEKLNNVSKNKLINISNDVFYNNDTQVNFSNDKNFSEKEYNISFKKDDFIEI